MLQNTRSAFAQYEILKTLDQSVARKLYRELLSETTKAANRIADFTGENGQTAFTLEGKFGIRLTMELASPFDLAEVFEQLAQENFYQALDASKAFAGDSPKALVMIAIGRAVLEDKKVE